MWCGISLYKVLFYEVLSTEQLVYIYYLLPPMLRSEYISLVEPKTSKTRFPQLQSMVVTRLIPIFVALAMTACLAKPYLNLLDQLKGKRTAFAFVGIKLLNFIWSRISIPAPALPPSPHPRSLPSCQKNHTILMCIKGACILREVE